LIEALQYRKLLEHARRGPARCGHSGEPLEESVNGDLAVLDGGTLLLGERNLDEYRPVSAARRTSCRTALGYGLAAGADEIRELFEGNASPGRQAEDAASRVLVGCQHNAVARSMREARACHPPGRWD
jgi:hypothetical protein